MPPRRSRGVAALLLLPALACATPGVEEEARLGEDFAHEIKREVVFLSDPVVEGYLRELGARILEAAGPQPFEYEFHVVRDPEVNAFAGPAGHIYVHTGTILMARNRAELAGVLAHEIAHVALRHVAQNLARQRTTGWIRQAGVAAAGILAGPAAAGAANLGTGLAAMAVLNSFGREAEREADAFAVEVLPRAGIDPRGLPAFFETLRNQDPREPPAFLSSHPATEERMRRTRAMIDPAALPPGLRLRDGGRFEIIQERVRLLTRPRRHLSRRHP